MKNVLLLLTCWAFVACGSTAVDDSEFSIISKFNSTWNIYEELVHNSDGSITYYALPWGGLVGSVKERNMSVDWSKYESIRFDFAEPTKVPTQIMVSDKVKTWGKAGITSLTCYFDGVALQASDTTVITVKSVYLSPGNVVWEATPIWEGNCEQGNWEKGFVIKPENFTTAYEGDKLEIVFTTAKSNPNVTFWLLKTIYNGTDSTLEGNASELNDWGCATIEMLREKGAFINGYYNNITQCNLLKKGSAQDVEE